MADLTPVPSEPTRTTVERYFGLVEAGVLSPDDRGAPSGGDQLPPPSAALISFSVPRFFCRPSTCSCISASVVPILAAVPSGPPASAAFFAIGVYTSVALHKIGMSPGRYLPEGLASGLAPILPLPIPLLALAGGIVAGIVGFGMGYLTLRLRGVLRSDELVRTRGGRRVRVAGAVITRQRPGTAKGMVFLTLEDEFGLANVIIRPDVFERQRPLILRAPFLVVEGVLQQQEGVTSVRAERVMGFAGEQPRVPSHDFR